MASPRLRRRPTALADADTDAADAVPAIALAAVQRRAHATRDALLAAGRQLLTRHDVESLAIADIAGACGLSVGSFYGRFRDKETFFAVLQQQITDEWVRDARQALQAPAQLKQLLHLGRVHLALCLELGRVRAALIPAVTVPVCVIATFIALYAFDFSINLLTLLAMVLVGSLMLQSATHQLLMPLVFIPFLLLSWLAVRGGLGLASLGVLLLSALTAWGTVQGLGPFYRSSVHEGLALL